MERLDAFMARANAAYYATHDPFADFTTAPEISQAFGEVLGAWAAATWQAMGRPEPVLLAEAGPGRGTLMADALRVVGRVAPDFARALRLHLVETSPRLRAAAAAKLPQAAWHDATDTLPSGPLLLLANEFLDALPIRQFVRRGEGWAERFVSDARFVEDPARATSLPRIHLSPPSPPTMGGEASFAEGAIVEVGEAARAWVASLACRIAAQGGAALILDYGPGESATGESLQAVRGGKPGDPLADPGSADLTSHVDFAALAAAAREAGAAVFGPELQGMFLARIGLYQRTDALARANPDRAAALIAAAQRLAEPHSMGRLFKALAICHPALPFAAGFAA